MTRGELINEIYDALPYRARAKIPRVFVERIVKRVFELIMESTCLGEEVKIRGFGAFKPYERPSIRVYCGLTGEYTQAKEHIRVTLRPSKAWRAALQKGIEMEKYGYQPDQESQKTKTAAEKGRCPICGAEVKGSPPVCPNHGSEPFEERDAEEEQG